MVSAPGIGEKLDSDGAVGRGGRRAYQGLRVSLRFARLLSQAVERRLHLACRRQDEPLGAVLDGVVVAARVGEAARGLRAQLDALLRGIGHSEQ